MLACRWRVVDGSDVYRAFCFRSGGNWRPGVLLAAVVVAAARPAGRLPVARRRFGSG